MTFVLTQEEHRRLVRWQRRMVGLFVGIWAYLLLVISAQIFLEPPPKFIQLALVPALGLVVAAGFVQFSARCPSCGYRLGRQSRLLVPVRCRSCRVSLRLPNGTA